MKVCTTCRKPKSEKCFYHYSDGRLFGRCKTCSGKKGEEYRLKNKEKIIRRHMVRRLKVKYGITVETYDDLLKYQGGVCAICGGDGKWKMLGVDHNHATGKIRGLLCHSCNVLIGHARESSSILEKAISYLASTKIPTKRMWVGDNDHEPEKSGWQDIPIV